MLTGISPAHNSLTDEQRARERSIHSGLTDYEFAQASLAPESRAITIDLDEPVTSVEAWLNNMNAEDAPVDGSEVASQYVEPSAEARAMGARVIGATSGEQEVVKTEQEVNAEIQQGIADLTDYLDQVSSASIGAPIALFQRK